MKKTLFLFAVVAMFFGAASCQKENIDLDNGFAPESESRIDCTDDPMRTIRVYIKTDGTKMAFEENQDKKLHRDWEVGDIIDGCSPVTRKDQSTTFESFQYRVSETGYDTEKHRNYIVLEKHSGKAGVPSAEKGTPVHFVYAPGAVSFNSEDGTCMLDLSNQTEEIPAVMTASGVVGDESEGKRLSLEFEYVAAVIKIVNPQLKENDGETPVTGTIDIDKVSVSALTKGVMNLVEDGNKNCGYELDDTSVEAGIASVCRDCQTEPVFVAVLPGTCWIDASIFATFGESQDDSACFQFYSEDEITFKSGDYKGISNKSFLRMDDYVAAIWNNNEGFYEYYTSLTEAVNIANDADRDVTIEMMMDTDLSSAVAIENINRKTTTLNLNGCTISYSGDIFISAITANTELVVNDAKNKGGIKADRCALCANTGVLTINGGTFAGSSETGVVYSEDEGSKLTINGGVIKCICGKYGGIAVSVRNDSFIYGGTIICKGVGCALRQYADGTCTVDGEKVVIYSNSPEQSPVSATGANSRIDFINGYVYADSDKDIFTVSEGGSAIVKGGYFNKLVTDGGNVFFAEGKTCMPIDPVQDSDGHSYSYVVADDPNPKDLVTINGTAYQSYSKAFKAMSALEGPIEVKLLEDGECSGIEFNDKQEISIDLNGKVLTTSVVSSAKTLSISDGSIEGTGELAGTKSLVALTVNTGTVTMTGGTITGSSNGGVYINGPTQANHPVFNMSGGKIVSDAKPASLGGSTGTYASLSIIDGGEFNFSGGVIENTAKSSTALFIKSSNANNDIFPEFNMTGGQIKGAHYAFYPHTHAKVNFMGGQITTNNRISHNGTSNKDCVITIAGGYFHATGYDAGKKISGFNAASVKAFHISGGYWNDDPIANGTKAHSAQPLKLEDGYKVVKLETPVVIGDLTYNYQVVAK